MRPLSVPPRSIRDRRSPRNGGRCRHSPANGVSWRLSRNFVMLTICRGQGALALHPWRGTIGFYGVFLNQHGATGPPCGRRLAIVTLLMIGLRKAQANTTIPLSAGGPEGPRPVMNGPGQNSPLLPTRGDRDRSFFTRPSAGALSIFLSLWYRSPPSVGLCHRPFRCSALGFCCARFGGGCSSLALCRSLGRFFGRAAGLHG